MASEILTKHFLEKDGNDVDDMLAGVLAARPDVSILEGHRVVVRSDFEDLKKSGKVALVCGGGSGHEPAHGGYVGRGMLTAAVAGGIFASPPVAAVLAALRAVCGPAGALLIIKNYTGDRLAFGKATAQARSEGLKVEMVVAGDDCARLDTGSKVGRRGLAGTVLIHKICGAAAEKGATLSEVRALADWVQSSMGTMGAALTVCSLPRQPLSKRIGHDEMELGLGIHGEPGQQKEQIGYCSDIARALLDRIIDSEYTNIRKGDEVFLIVNNLGGTSVLEIHIFVGVALRILREMGITPVRALVGSIMTSLDMKGISVTLLPISTVSSATSKDTILEYIDASTDAPAWPSSTAIRPANSSPVVPGSRFEPENKEEEGKGPQFTEEEFKVFRSRVANGCRALQSITSELNNLDQLVGDGDCGETFQKGAESVISALEKESSRSPATVLLRLANVISVAMGGTSGAILEIFLRQCSTSFANSSEVNERVWVEAVKSSLQEVMAIGGAQEGDRTMVDACLPAVNAAENALKESSEPSSVLSAAATAGKRGAESTAGMTAGAGRSCYVPEEAQKGVVDPGATAIAKFLEGLAE